MFLAVAFNVLCGFVGCALLVRIFRPVAFRTGFVDQPDARKRHAEPTPAIGGLAIFVIVILVGLLFHPWTPRFLGLDLAALLVVIVGMIDDHRHLGWRKRMVAQAVAGLILALVAGLRVTDLGTIFGVPLHLSEPFSVLLTVVSTVGAINAVNMIDGLDGLAGAVTLASLLMLTGLAAYAGDAALTKNFALTVGAVGGFLLFNIRWPGTTRASVFLGNAGAELIGLLLAAACFRLTQDATHPLQVKVAPFMLAPALIDCLTVITRRLTRGASPFLAGRDHLHEVLLDAGYSVNGVVAIMTTATLLIGLLAFLVSNSRAPDFVFTLGFLGLWLACGLSPRPRSRLALETSNPAASAPVRGARAERLVGG